MVPGPFKRAEKPATRRNRVPAPFKRTRFPNAPESLESKQDIPRLQLENPKPVTFWNIALCAKRIYAAAV